MNINHSFELSYVTIAFAIVGAIVIGGLLATMHMKHKYHPNLIGALLCLLLIEALPALT